MSLIEPVVKELRQEATVTRKLLERVPEEHFDWKPHEKSMTLRELASHLADIPKWAEVVADQDRFEIDPSQYQPFSARSREHLLQHFETCLENAARKMEGKSDQHMLAMWSLVADGKVYFEMPRIAVLRSMILSHAIHHRGQLSVYLRLRDVPVPAIYGPSADEEA